MLKKCLIFFLILSCVNQIFTMDKHHSQYPRKSSTSSLRKRPSWGAKLWNNLSNAYNAAGEELYEEGAAIAHYVGSLFQTTSETLSSTNSKKEKRYHVYRLLIGFSSSVATTLMGIREIARPTGNHPLGLLTTTIGTVGIWAMSHELYDNANTLKSLL